MPMLCLAGTFRVLATQPDGDSVRFVATEPQQWELVEGQHRVRVNAHGGAQLRLDAIDALETHYTPRGGSTLHQPPALSHEAGAELLAWLGFADVARDEETVTHVAVDDRPGFVLTRTADTNGRCVALVGRGAAPAASGTSINVDVDLLRQTANHHLLASGLVYPTFYSKLYVDLRRELASLVATARDAGAGVFAADATQSGAEISSATTLTDDAVILPKLFRRLADYLHLNDGSLSMAGFAEFLAQRDDRLYVISAAQRTGLDTVVEVSGQTVSLTRPPEDLIFDEQ